MGLISAHSDPQARRAAKWRYASFLTAEIAMAAANSEAPIVTRTQAEKLLDLYFGLVEQAVPWTENNPLDRRS